MSHLWLLLIAVVVVAWLTAASIALRSASRIWLRHWVERRLTGSEVAADFLERPQRLILAASAGTGVTLILAGLLIGQAYRGWPAGLIVAIVVMSLGLLLFGQIVPTALGRRFASRLVPVLVPPLRLLEVLVAPVILLAGAVASVVARRTGRATRSEARDHIEDVLREGALEGVGERDEIAIITGVVQFGEKLVRDVMTPRDEVFALDEALPADELARRIAQAAYSRVPLYRGSSEVIVGMVHAFDVLKAGGEHPPTLRPVAYTPETKRCSDLLFEMLRARMHLAVVLDDAGRTAGIVTLEDLLEELVGDIRDEHDEPVKIEGSSSERSILEARSAAAPGGER
jgi:magnesium and cobalt exporter, CNNM family